MKEVKNITKQAAKTQDPETITIDDLKLAIEAAGVEENVLLPPGYQRRAAKKQAASFKRAGKPVYDAKYDSDFWNKYDQVIYITVEHAEKILQSPECPKALKKILLFNLDQFDKENWYMDGKSVAINITKLIEHDVFGFPVDKIMPNKEDEDVD